ncbi:Membrane carboxypeptidase (penicillin-binding protein) [Amycolatopsis tolypomycina]|uniref:Membrane carboxypeptidase (Penicillin-binding protein) n=1 Tax=Amycolatopsis tolypomycina TaxID=208445 RepID=A0A1H4J0Z1_9PSEU|nr:transglycosylase domain-containing protein [Amycolatopsis tolypomycina]SEB39903.1 Membrane carboxypeptidase (penicillin-binding protein) [Amycolatopsis tolypomycina]
MYTDRNRSRLGRRPVPRGRYQPRRPLPRPDEPDEPTADIAADPRRRRWKTVRRVVYVLSGLFFLVPAVAFVITYFAVDVPSPASVAQSQGQAVTYLYADGTEMGKDVPTGGNRQLLDPAQIPDVVKKAVIATEDASFETNSGFDVSGILRAAYNQVTGGSGGGSTISQQYIKNASGDDAPTLTRKWVELAKSFKMNQTYEKADIITAYLNIIYFGRGAYGIQAAAQAFYGKDAAQLNFSESALLAGLIQQPGRSENPTVARDRWSTALDRMQRNGYLSAADRKAARFPTPIPLVESRQGNTVNPFVKKQVKAELAAAGIPEEKYYSGGFQVFTTIDSKAQDAAEQAVAQGMAGQTDDRVLGAMVAVDPKTGGVLAYYGGEPIVKGPNGEDQAGRDWADEAHNPGSSMKPFDLTAFLKGGRGLNAVFDGRSPRSFPDVPLPVRNAGASSSCSEVCTVAEAMQRSTNTVFYDMVLNVTKPAGVAEAAQEAGIRTKDNGGRSVLFTGDNNISIGGGQTAVTPADMASAYATFAAGGIQHSRHFVQKVTNSQGETAYETGARATDAFADNDRDRSRQIAGNVTAALAPVIPFSRLSCPAGHECAGKTGTQQHTPAADEPASAANTNSQTWMVGYTPSVSAAVWVGGDGDKALRGPNGAPLTPSVVAGPVWQRFMQLYLAGKPAERFDRVQAITAPQDDQLQFQLQLRQQQVQQQQQQQQQDDDRFTIGRGDNRDQRQQQQDGVRGNDRRDGRGRGNGNDTGQANFGP